MPAAVIAAGDGFRRDAPIVDRGCGFGGEPDELVEERRPFLGADDVVTAVAHAAVSEPLAAVIDLALVDKPRIHFQTAQDFKRALEGVL